MKLLKNLHIWMIYGMCVFSSLLGIESEKPRESSSLPQKQASLSIPSGNPFKRLPSFVFYFINPVSNYSLETKVRPMIERQLAQIGEIRPWKMLTKKNDKEVVDLSGFDASAFLIYELEEVSSIEGKKLGIIQASLKVSTYVEVKKSGEECRPYIWSTRCYIQGDFEKNLETLIDQSLGHLLRDFKASYQSVNTAQPVFNFDAS